MLCQRWTICAGVVVWAVGVLGGCAGVACELLPEGIVRKFDLVVKSRYEKYYKEKYYKNSSIVN